MTEECLPRIQKQINHILKLDSKVVEPLLNAFHHNGWFYVVNPYLYQGYYDFYRLMHVRQSFSEHSLSEIAYQLLT